MPLEIHNEMDDALDDAAPLKTTVWSGHSSIEVIDGCTSIEADPYSRHSISATTPELIKKYH